MEKQYRTLSGRCFDLEKLTPEERTFLAELSDIYAARPDWNEFARTWMRLARERLWPKQRVPVGTPVYRICQDMESRLGVAEGKVAAPDYRDRIADLIEDRYGSRYAFCKETGLDQGNLSRVLTGRTRHLSPETLFQVLDHLRVEIELVDKREVFEVALDPFQTGTPSPDRAEQYAERVERRVGHARAKLTTAPQDSPRQRDDPESIGARLESVERTLEELVSLMRQSAPRWSPSSKAAREPASGKKARRAPAR